MASSGDLPEICRLLEACGLPAADLTPALLENFLVRREGGALLAVGGLEWIDGAALLRSVAVAEPKRASGIGRSLVAALERRARCQGARSLYLLTTTAEGYFGVQGYRSVPREHAPAGIRQTAQFAGLCPSSAAFMVKALEPAA